jgi:uncharacterized protein with FMN-binding domain
MKIIHKRRTVSTWTSILIILTAVTIFTPGCAGFQPKVVESIPNGTYIGKYIRNGEDYTAVVLVETGSIQSIDLKYNGSPLTESWAISQVKLVVEKNSTRIKILSSPLGKNKAVVKAIDLALESGLKLKN